LAKVREFEVYYLYLRSNKTIKKLDLPFWFISHSTVSNCYNPFKRKSLSS